MKGTTISPRSGRVTGKIKAGDGGTLLDRMHRNPADILVERAELGEALTLLGRRGLAVGILDLPQNAVTLAFDQSRTSEKESERARETILVRSLLGAKDKIGAGNRLPGDKAGAIQLAVAGTVRRARSRAECWLWLGTELGWGQMRQHGSGQQGDCNHQMFHPVLSFQPHERRLPQK